MKGRAMPLPANGAFCQVWDFMIHMRTLNAENLAVEAGGPRGVSIAAMSRNRH